MNPFQALLGQQMSAQGFHEENMPVIPVVGNRNRPPTKSDYSEVTDNNAEAVINREQDVRASQEASDRRGLFGVKGTLRDILGIVGDAFLIQSGNAPMYAPQRRREQISDAGAGFSLGGDQSRAAAERVGYFDLGMGTDLLADAQNTELKTAQQESLAAGRDSLSADRKFKQYKLAREQIGGLFNTPGAVSNGQISPQALARAEQIAASAGMTLEQFMVAENMSEEEVRDYAIGVLNPYEQERLEDADIGLQQGQQRADATTMNAVSNRTRANRAPTGRASRAESDREAAIRIGNKPANERTQGEKAFYEKYTRQPGSSSTRTRPRSVPSSSRFRPASN